MRFVSFSIPGTNSLKSATQCYFLCFLFIYLSLVSVSIPGTNSLKSASQYISLYHVSIYRTFDHSSHVAERVERKVEVSQRRQRMHVLPKKGEKKKTNYLLSKVTILEDDFFEN